MNRYFCEFIAECPNNQKNIKYSLTIETNEMIMVEELTQFLKDNCSLGYHEKMADDLICSFGGKQYLVAKHENVLIETFRQ